MSKYSEEERKKILKNRENCVFETKVDAELIDKADKGDFVDDEKLKCFTKCFYQKAGFVTENGDLLLDTIKAKIPATVDKEKALKVIEKCQQKGKDACETVFLVHKCYFEYTHPPAELQKEPVKADDKRDVRDSNENQSEKKNESLNESSKESPSENQNEGPKK
ncbi:hypothetical protein NQ314_014905 [Rhamnusium bicolor]|uniref:Uncharacterized protein n=1 Tax=Rhamnusium bicolor TaxID=1586634 RepID=A0AAV8WZI8_9CUCU|nr:hypothetical protein NQ314_014905 [Rhamnusium bicolor]